jgi:bacterioferritin-associated ferredoxin
VVGVRLHECEIREVIPRGARSEEAVGEACGAGTGCGTCLDRIDELVGGQAAGAPLDAIAA